MHLAREFMCFLSATQGNFDTVWRAVYKDS